MCLFQPLTGFAAFKKCVERIHPAGGTIWLKFSHNQFFTGQSNLTGKFGIWATEGQGTDRKKTNFIQDAFVHLSALSQAHAAGGVFYIPGQPTDFPLKDYCVEAADIGAEMDDGTAEEQWQRIEWLSAVSGLEPGLIINSGGKSAHPHWFLDTPISIAQATHLKKLLAIALLSDPAVVNPHQPMRIAGFYRQEKGKEQTLDYWSDCRYTQEQFLQGLRAAFQAKGYIFPEQLSEERWRRIRRVLTNKELTPKAKSSQIKDILAMDEAVFHPLPQQYAHQYNFTYNGDCIPLELCLSKDDRELIARGIGEGSRSISGNKLALNLIGTARFLDAKHIAYQSDPRLLFDDFCSRCSPALSSREADGIWRSASRGNPKPTLSDDAIENCISAWQARQNPQRLKHDLALSSDEWEWKFGLPNWFRNQLVKFPKVFKGFGKPPALPKPVENTKSSPQPKIIQYIPGERLPTPEQYKAMGCPIIHFKKGQRLQLIAELVTLGHHDILDNSGTGSSKSYESGLFEPMTLGVDRLWYFSRDHRNPTTATVEANFTDMPVRHNGRDKGLIEDSTSKTALGRSHIRWARQDETPTIHGNCHRAGDFHLLNTKGYFQVNNSAENNPICGGCHRQHECRTGAIAPGAGFRNEKARTGKSPRIRSSLDSVFDTNQLQKSGAFYDEAMAQFKPTETIEVQLSDFERVFGIIESQLPQVYEDLKPFRLTLRPILAGQVKLTSETRYGWTDSALRAAIGKVPPNIEDIINEIKAIQPDLKKILQEPDSFTLQGVNAAQRQDFSRETSKRLRSLLRRDSYRQMSNDLKALPANWLVPFLEVWSGFQPFGSLRLNHCVLSVTTRNTRHSEIAKAMQFNVYLDATADPKYLAMYLNIDLTDIVQIEQEPQRFENLTIVQVNGLGLVGHERSNSLKARVTALKEELKQGYPDINFFDHKEHAEPGEGYYFRDNRGSNKYKERSALASFGIPYRNIGHLQDLYLTLTGDRNLDKNAPGFADFVEWHTQSEIAQTVGRLRANLRPQEQITYFSCADYDLKFLQEFFPGAIIKQKDAVNITPAAGTAGEQTRWALLQAARQIAEAGLKLTQTALATAAGVTQGRISQIASEVGGWKALKKILASLLEVLHRTTNIFEPLGEDELWMAQTFLPLAVTEDISEAIKQVTFVAKVYGWKTFKAILTVTPIKTKSQLLTLLVGLLPPLVQEEFSALVVT